MKVYTYSQARQQLAALLDQVVREGSIRIRRRDGTLFTVERVGGGKSDLDVPGVDTDVTTEEILTVLRESRARSAARGSVARRPRRPSAGRGAGKKRGPRQP